MTKSQQKETQEKADRLPPHNAEAEQSVLGAILIDPLAICKVMDSLKPEHFYRQSHRFIYTAMLALFNKNSPTDIVAVSDYLKSKEQLEIVGGRAYINDLALSVISSANVEYHSKLIAEKSVSRELISAGSEIVQLGFEEIEPDAALNAAEQMIFSITQKKTGEELTPVDSILMNSYERIESRYKNKGELIGLPSGFYDLDALTAGFQKSDLIIIAARPSMGKTAFCLNIAQEVGIKEKKPVAIFSLEMSKEQLVERMMCSEAEVDSNRLRTGHLSTDDWTKLAQTMGKIGECPIYIDDSPGVSIVDIRAKCRRMLSKNKDLGLIIIDYLQLMESSGKKSFDRVQEISQISRGLKNLAREPKVPIISLSQLSRAVESRQDKRPMLSDLRESGSIEQDADLVMFIYRDEYYNPDNMDSRGKAEIILAKQRNGPTGKVELLFQGNVTKFRNPAKSKTNLF